MTREEIYAEITEISDLLYVLATEQDIPEITPYLYELMDRLDALKERL